MGQLSAAAFQGYVAANAGSIAAGPFALYSVSLSAILPTQNNEGYSEVGTKTAAWDLIGSGAALNAALLSSIEPVVIGPGGALYLLDGHHTFTSLANSTWGSSNPTVYVNVIANWSGLTTSQFWTQMQASNFDLALSNGTPQTIDPLSGAPIPGSLTALANDPYRGLEYEILKNKSSSLFTTTGNITGAAGASTPGLDKITGLYSDFIWAQAYRSALGGAGLPYLSAGDIALATQWNLNGANTTTMPGYGTVHVYQLPGFILSQAISVATTISDATLSGGTLDGNGTFTGITSVTFGTTTLGTVRQGLILQLGADKGFGVTLSGTNTYTGGTTLIAGTLTIGSDAALGAAAPASYTINQGSIAADVRAANGIVFNSLSEGAATLVIGTTAGGGTGTFTTNRPIAVAGESATLNPDGYIVTLTGQIASLGSGGVGLSNATGFADFTINDKSSGAKGVVVLAPTSGSNALFYGNWIISAGTLRVSSDAALGSTTIGSAVLGQIDLDGGTLQAGASFTSARSLFLTGGSTIDTAGFSVGFSGTLTDVQRTLTITNSSTTAAGAITLGTLAIGATATLKLTGGTAGETVTLSNGISRAASATLFVTPSGTSSLGSTEKVLFGTAPSLTNGIVAPWMITDSGGATSTNPYDFLTYGANGLVKATYGKTGSSSSTGLAVATSSDVVEETGSYTLTANASAYALKIDNAATLTATGKTITLGNGTGQAGLILTADTITGGTIAFGAAEADIYVKGTSTVSAALTGSGGLVLAGSGTLTLGAAATLSGGVTIDSGTLSLTVANALAGNAAGVTLGDVKSAPAAAGLTFTASQTFATLNSSGNNSTVSFSNGATLIIGDSNNLSSTLASAITETGTAVAGALTKAGSGLADLSAVASGKLTLLAGSTIAVNGGQLRLYAKSLANGNGITVASGAEVQFAEKGGSVYAGSITGAGAMRLVSGTLKLTGTGHTYSGGTYIESGTTLDLTTANVSTGNADIHAAGGQVLFDQTTNGTYAGVISDAALMGTGPVQSGVLIKDDSVNDNAGIVTLTKVQTFTGATWIEAGGIDLTATDALAASAGVTLGRVGGGATASLTIDANERIASLSSNSGNITSVLLDGHVLTLNGGTSSFAGTIGNGTTAGGALVLSGGATVTLSGANTFSGGVTLNSGTLELGHAQGAGTGAITFAAGAGATLKLDAGIVPANTITGFDATDTIDIAGTAYVTTGGASLGTGNVLTITEGSTSLSLTLSGSDVFTGKVFHVASDGAGGIAITLHAAPQLAATVDGSLVSASSEASVGFTVSGLVSGDTGTVTFADHLGGTISVAVNAATGAYTANLSGLADGAITETLHVDGNSYAQTGGGFTLDTTAPTVAITSAGGLTNAAVQTVAGTVDVADAGTTVTIHDGAAVLGTALVGADGTWSTSVTLSGDGAHTLTASDTDAAGNTSTSVGLGYTLDTTAPTVVIDTAGATVHAGTQTITGSVGVGDAGTTVTIRDGATVVGTALVGADGTWSTSVALSATGAHSLTASDTDAAGNTGTSATTTFAVNGALQLGGGAARVLLTPGSAVAIPAITLAEAGTTAGVTFSVTLSDNSGSIALTANGASVTGVGGHPVTVSGTLAQVGAALATVTVTANGSVADTLIVTASDSIGWTASGTAITLASAPLLARSAGSAGYAVGGAAVAVLGGITLTDGEATTITGARIAITGGFAAGDVLALTAQAGITSSYDAAHGVLTLSGTASLAAYRSALAAITYSSTASDPTLANTDATRTLSVTVDDGTQGSNILVAGVSLTKPVPQTIPIGTGLRNYVGGAGDDTFITLANGIGKNYTIAGGLGTDTLVLSGAGSFNLTKLAAIAGVEVLAVSEGQTSSGSHAATVQSVHLKSGMNLSVVIADGIPASGNAKPETISIFGAAGDASTIHLGHGRDVITLGDAAESVIGTASTATVKATAAQAAALISDAGGKITLDLSGGGPVALNPLDTGLANFVLEKSKVAWALTTDAEIGQTIIDKSATNDSFAIYGTDTAITLGKGSNTVAFHAEPGHAVITGFNVAGAHTDILALDKTLVADWSHLHADLHQQGKDLLITLDAHDSILLKGVSMAGFSAADVLFV